MKVLVGVDAGGSHVTAVAGIDSDVPVASASGGPANISGGQPELAISHILDAVHAVLIAAHVKSKPDILVIGAAGTSDRQRADRIQGMLDTRSPARRVHLTTDFDIAVEDTLCETPGILLIAGTGSVGCARLDDGELVRAGGRGWRFGDEGSGYHIGAAAIRQIYRSLDGRIPSTLITEKVLEQKGLENADRLITWARDAKPHEIADLSKAVFAAAEENDPIALEIVARSAIELYQLLESLASRFGAPLETAREICLHGGILSPGSPLRSELEQKIQSLPGFSLSRRRVDPARGALRLAHRLLGG